MVLKSIETKYFESGCIEDCVIDWAKEQGYKVRRNDKLQLTISIRGKTYIVINYKVCSDNMILIDLKF